MEWKKRYLLSLFRQVEHQTTWNQRYVCSGADVFIRVVSSPTFATPFLPLIPLELQLLWHRTKPFIVWLEPLLYNIALNSRAPNMSNTLNYLSFFFLIGLLFYLFIYLFIYWLYWVFVSVRGLCLVAASGGHSSSRCAGLSLSRPLLLWSTGSRRAGSVVVAYGRSCSVACGIFPDQGSNPCPLHWQADSQPLRHQGSPLSFFYEWQEGCFPERRLWWIMKNKKWTEREREGCTSQ